MRALALSFLALGGCGIAEYTPPTSDPGPSVQVVSAPQAVLTESTARFELESDHEGATFRVTLDGEVIGIYESPVVLEDLPDGPHRVAFRARARDGTLGKRWATHDWRVDTKPPVLRVAFPPERSLTDRGEIAVCGTAIEEGGVLRLLVNGRPATSTDDFRTWRVVVPVAPDGDTPLLVEIIDVAGRIAKDETRVVTAAEPPLPLPDEEGASADEFELVLRAKTGEAITVQSDCVVAIDADLGKRRLVSGLGRGKGEDFQDIVVMAGVPGTDEVAVFDTFKCRIFSVDLETGDRTILWERLGKSDIPATREGFLVSDGDYLYVQGPRAADLIRLSMDGKTRGVLASSGWVNDVVAMAYDADRDRLIAIGGSTGHVYAVDPGSGSVQVVSSHEAEHPLGFARGVVVSGDSAYAIARDHNGVVHIDMETGDREFLALVGDGLDQPRAIALDASGESVVVLSHGREGLMHIDLDTGECREKKIRSHAPRPECVGPIHFDPGTGELCVLDGGQCALVGVNPRTGAQRTVLDLAGVAPNAVDFAINPANGEPVVLERHGIYDFAPANVNCVLQPGDETCTVIPPDPAAPLGGGLAIRVDPDGGSAIILDSRPHVIDYDWIRATVRHDEMVRVLFSTGKCTVLAKRPATSMGETMSVMPRAYFDEESNRVYLGAVNCGPYGTCLNATLRLLDLGSGTASTIYGLTEVDEFGMSRVGGTTTPATEFAAMVPDPVRNRIYTLDREQGVVGYVQLDTSTPRYVVLSGDRPHFVSGEGWTTVPYGHGPSLERGQGLALDAEAGLLYVTSQDRVIVVDVVGGDRALAAVLE